MANTKIPVELSSTPGIVDNSNATAITIDSSENVGIGTSSPASKLSIENTGSSTVDAITLDWEHLSTTTNIEQRIQWRFGDDSTADTFLNAGYIGVGKQSSWQSGAERDSYLSFGTTSDNTQTERMRIDSSGNVGIGDTSPLAKLEIAGSKYVLTNSGQAIGGIHLRPDSNSASGEYGGAISFSCGSSGSSAIAAVNEGGSDTDSNGLAFMTHAASTGSADAIEVMRIDELGNVGIGTSSPDYKLHIEGTGNNLKLSRSGVGEFAIGVASGRNLVFEDKTAAAERMRIDSSGNLNLNTTGQTDAKFCVNNAAGQFGIKVNDFTSNGALIKFTRAATQVGSISTNGTSTTYNTTSDARLKDVTGAARGLEVINELNPVSYNWKADGKADEGLIAQEVQEIVPNAVTGSEEEMYQMDYSKLVVHLVAGMKEQQAQIEALQSEINLLKGE